MQISWRARQTNISVLQKMGKATLLNSINKRKLLFIGHVAKSEGLLGNDILSGMVSGKRRRGIPRRKLENDVEETLGMSMSGLLQSARNRQLHVPQRVSTDPSVPDDDDDDEIVESVLFQGQFCFLRWKEYVCSILSPNLWFVHPT